MKPTQNLSLACMAKSHKQCGGYASKECQFAIKNTVIMGDDTDYGRLLERVELYMEDTKELLEIVAECPNCSRRFKEYMKAKQRQRNELSNSHRQFDGQQHDCQCSCHLRK